MTTNDIALPEIDTQRMYDLKTNTINYSQNFKLCKGRSGVYWICRKQCRTAPTKCLYVGATKRLQLRAFRFFNKRPVYSDGFYLNCILHFIPKEHLVGFVKFAPVDQLRGLELAYSKHLRPIIDSSFMAYSHKEIVDTHKDI